MCKEKNRKIDRILSVFLAAIMIFSMMPATTFVNAAEADYTITVTNEEAELISGATIDYSINVDGEESENGTATTDENGVAVIDLTEYADEKADDKVVTIACNVTKDGYVAEEAEFTVDELNGNAIVTLEEIRIETVNITVSKTGNGTVTFNGDEDVAFIEKDTEVEIKVVPSEGFYIKAITVNGIAKTVTDDVEYTETVTADEDISVAVVFSTKYTVTVNSANDNGTIKLNDAAQNSLTVDSTEKVKISVTPAEGYQIASVLLNGAEQLTSNATIFEREVSAATTVDVTFVKIYQVTITYNNEDGSVQTDSDPDNEGGEVSVVSGQPSIFEIGKKFQIIADPNENYRVSEVKINGEAINDANIGINDQTYTSAKFDTDKDYSITVTFALNVYKVTAEYDNNQADVEFSESVQYDGSVDVTVTPKNNHIFTEIFINGESFEESEKAESTPVTDSDNGRVITISNITEDTKIELKFEKAEINFFADVILSDEGFIRQEGNTYIYESGASVVISTDKDEIRINNDKQSDAKNITLTETTEIKTIHINDKWNLSDDGWDRWSKLEDFDGIKIVIDDDKPEGTIAAMQENFYNDNFDVKFTASEKETSECSGIAKIEYQTYHIVDGNEIIIQGKNNPGGDTGVLYEYAPENVEHRKDVSVNIDAERHNYEYGKVFIRFIVSDIAGNISENIEQPLKVNIEPPSVTITLNGKNEGNYAGKTQADHYQAATATIVFNDRKDTFDKDAAYNSIQVTGEGFNMEASTVWNNQTAIITFSDDAHYTLKVVDYTNKADLSCNSDTIKNFYVDTKAPTGEISAAGSKWMALVEKITFGIFKNNSITVTATATDAVSGIQEIAYYKDNGTELLTDAQLDELYENGKFTTEEYIVGDDETESERFVVYARITDNAGMYMYIGTNGIVYDKTESAIAEFNMPAYPENQPEDLNIYNGDIEIGVNVSEIGWQALNTDGTIEEIYSGLNEIRYEIYTNRIDNDNPGTLTAEGILFKAEIVDSDEKSYNVYNWNWDTEKLDNIQSIENLPAYADLVKEWSDIVRVDAATNNTDNVTLVITATDNAGNVSIEDKHFSINVDRPIVNIEIGKFNEESGLIDTGVKPVNTVEDRGYYDAPRQAVITLIERSTAFNAENATNAIKITAKDVNGADVEDAFSITPWLSTYNEVNGKSEFRAVITFNKDANYTFSFEGYTNNAMKDFESAETTYSVTGYTVNAFTVDTTDPTGTVTVLENTWNKLLSTLTFGLFSQDDVEVTATYEDATSSLNKVEYYKTTNPIALTLEQLDELYANEKFKSYKKFADPEAENIKVSPDEQFVIYYRIEDKAGNYTYINSDGCIVDDTHSDIVITPAEPLFTTEGIGNYNGDVKVDISVSESENTENYAGIRSIEYWVIKDGKTETQRKTLYSFDYARDTAENNMNINGGSIVETDWSTGEKVVSESEGPAQAMLKKSWSGSVVVDSALNNSCNVVVYVKTVDNAGNEDTKSIPLDIDITAPSIDITYNNNKDNNGNGYFAADRTATVVITERSSHFDSKQATEGIVITSVNAKNVIVEDAYVISNWTTVEGATPDEAKHTATIHFAKDANYTFEISYTDNSENNNTAVNTHDSVSPYKFTVDTVKPFGTITTKSKEGRTTEWNKLITDLTFGFWSREEISVTSTSDDETSPIASVEYYIDEAKEGEDASDALSTEALDAVTGWQTLEKLSIADNKRFTVYLRLTDNAGNYSYISTDGLIVDEEAPVEEVIAPEVTVMPEQPINGFYNGDVKVAIKVVDPLVKGAYSGLKTVSYKVYDKAVSETEPTQSGTLYTFVTENPKQDQLLKEWTGQITVDSSANNSNDVVIEVFAEDNSLNTSRDDVSIKIDVTAPKINVSYNNNEVDSDSFFKADRTATIVITERNFNPDDVIINITNTDDKVPEITAWEQTAGTGNLDDTKWTTTVTYDKDGDYTFDIDYTDVAGNKCNGADYGESKAAEMFTIDKTAPVISVSYDNNNAKNGKYFAEERTATIVIDEHNFDINRVDIISTASLDGNNIAVPDALWSHSGDVHTATINYAADGDYTFDIKVNDKAGNENEAVNYGDSVAGEEFTVDKTIEKPVINGVENGKAYKDDVIPSISFSDVNYDTYEVKLLRSRMGEKNVDVTSQFMSGISQSATGGSGTYDTFEKIAANDGIYTLSVKVTDKAGNENSNSVTFTVNRFGSVYEYDNYLIDSIRKCYITSISEDLVITEYNADRLVGGSLNIEITRDGKPLENVQYDVSPAINETVAVGSSGWFQYEYTISPANFDADGIYKIFVSSEDATGNKPENSNYEDMAITFMVDSTAPEITSISGLEEAIINATDQEVKYTVFDTIGLKSIKIIVDGVQIGETITDFSVDLNNYSGSFMLSEKSPAQTVQIIVEDLAGNVTDTESETFTCEYVFNSSVTVSTNIFVRWYANKALFWGSIAGTLALAAAITLIVAKRRKKNEA